jgi:hypothetical protein
LEIKRSSSPNHHRLRYRLKRYFETDFF